MTNELLPLKKEYTPIFKKSLKRLGKKYRSIKKDVQIFIDSIKSDTFPGDVLQGIETEAIVYKCRVQNSDNNKGKSGGYRVIYAYFDPDLILLVQIFSKSDQPDITPNEINGIISAYQFEQGTED